MTNSGKIYFIFYTPLCKIYVADTCFGQKCHEDIMGFLSFKLTESRIPSLPTFPKKPMLHHAVRSFGLGKRLAEWFCRKSEQKVIAFGFGLQISELLNLPVRDEQNTI